MEKCFENLIYGGDKESDKESNSLTMQNVTAHETCEKMKERHYKRKRQKFLKNYRVVKL